MSRWILIAIIVLNIYIFLNMSNASRADIAHTVAQIPAKVGDVIHNFATNIDEAGYAANN